MRRISEVPSWFVFIGLLAFVVTSVVIAAGQSTYPQVLVQRVTSTTCQDTGTFQYAFETIGEATSRVVTTKGKFIVDGRLTVMLVGQPVYLCENTDGQWLRLGGGQSRHVFRIAR